MRYVSFLLFFMLFACKPKDSIPESGAIPHRIRVLKTNFQRVSFPPPPRDSIPGVYSGSKSYADLSPQFDFTLRLRQIRHSTWTDSSVVTIRVKRKSDKETVYVHRFSSTFLLSENPFLDGNVRSYTTEKNRNREVVDNDYGDFIVADFNFDRRDDFAVKTDEMGNGGPLYDYFLQTPDSSFIRDKFLSETVRWFPHSMDKKKRTLTTLVHASAYSLSETTYQLDTVTHAWKEIRSRLVGY